MMNRADYLAVFRRDPKIVPPAEHALLLPTWSEADWNKLLDHTRIRAMRASELVIQRGADDRAVYFIAAGTLEVGVADFGGVSIVPLALIGAGNVVGEQSFFDGLPRSANVWAVSDGELLQLEFEAFTRFSREQPMLARDLVFGLARLLSMRLRNTTFRVSR
jgi:CRP/FNR family transcriptional regulator, cyclic AMP receptor protein